MVKFVLHYCKLDLGSAANMRDYYRRLGQSEIKVSTVAMGCWPIAGMTSLNVNESDSLGTLQAAIESGINFFDTAFCYGLDGLSERLIGKAFAANRQSVVVASKCGVHWDSAGKKVVDGSRDRLFRECDESLSRLKTDYIDLLYLHEPDPNTPIEDSAHALAELKQNGKVREIGISNATLAQTIRFHAACPIVAVQPPFNLMQQQKVDDLQPWCQEQSISVVSYWPLMKGLLAGKIRRNHKFDSNDKRLTYEIFQGEHFERAQRVVDQLELIAQELQTTISTLVIAWTIAQPTVTATLCGAKLDWQIQETAAAMGLTLDKTVVDNINKLVDVEAA